MVFSRLSPHKQQNDACGDHCTAGNSRTYAQGVRARISYVAEEVIFNARFLNILEWTESGSASVDVRRIGEVERVA